MNEVEAGEDGHAQGTSSLVVLGPSLRVADKEDKTPDKATKGPNEATARCRRPMLTADGNLRTPLNGV